MASAEDTGRMAAVRRVLTWLVIAQITLLAVTGIYLVSPPPLRTRDLDGRLRCAGDLPNICHGFVA